MAVSSSAGEQGNCVQEERAVHGCKPYNCTTAFLRKLVQCDSGNAPCTGSGHRVLSRDAVCNTHASMQPKVSWKPASSKTKDAKPWRANNFQFNSHTFEPNKLRIRIALKK